MSRYILDMERYNGLARQAAAEGQVLLENNGVLPLAEGTEVAVFGRIQTHYYKSGTGSGGMVNVSRTVGIVDALEESGTVTVNQKLKGIYTEWEKENPFFEGQGWGAEPWSQEEMEVSGELAAEIAADTDTALVIIGRTAGEDRDNTVTPGAYLLSAKEEKVLKTVRKHFAKLVIVLNVGNIIDLSMIETYAPDAVLLAWQGGMLGGYGTADVLTGKVNPCGKLSDTIAYEVADYAATENFGSPERNFYAEDIFVGYRYFETAAKDRVRYPFGFGRSYTSFEQSVSAFSADSEKAEVKVSVKNTGNAAGKEVVQIYLQAPCGKLGKAAVSLVEFGKTAVLAPGEETELGFSIPVYAMSSYDETGVTGFASGYVLEAGEYVILAGSSSRDLVKAGSFEVPETRLLEKLEQAVAPKTPFDRLHAVEEDGKVVFVKEPTPLKSGENKRLSRLPKEIAQTGDRGYKLSDVKAGRVSMEDFIAQFSDRDLCSIARGEGMGSPKVTAGTAAAFGGVTESLKGFGLPCACCDDGPSGMRLDSGIKAFSLPNGTLLACTFNPGLVADLYAELGIEMVKNKVECLLGPGMNIHRHPLNGRNFEYFSEDPLVTGRMGAAIFKGLHRAGVTGVAKHFCGNNQELARHSADSIISERALREIYLKGFEIAVKEGGADAFMTTYGRVNGVWTSGIYELNTTILRDEWGFTGIVMTDWWAQISEEGVAPSRDNYAGMVRSQNDLYMVCQDASDNFDNLDAELAEGKITRGEVQRTAANICRFLMDTQAYKRFIGEEVAVEVIGGSEEDSDDNADVVYYELGKELCVDLGSFDTGKGKDVTFGIDAGDGGEFAMTIIAKSGLSELAQLPIAYFQNGIPLATFTFNGSNDQWVTIEKTALFPSRYAVVRLHFVQNGLDVKEIRYTFRKTMEQVREEHGGYWV